MSDTMLPFLELEDLLSTWAGRWPDDLYDQPTTKNREKERERERERERKRVAMRVRYEALVSTVRV